MDNLERMSSIKIKVYNETQERKAVKFLKEQRFKILEHDNYLVNITGSYPIKLFIDKGFVVNFAHTGKDHIL